MPLLRERSSHVMGAATGFHRDNASRQLCAKCDHPLALSDVACTVLERLPDRDLLHGDKGYDSNAIRRQVEERDAMANIPPKANRKWKNCFSSFLYRNPNAIERSSAA
jgi:hypothetical protein